MIRPGDLERLYAQGQDGMRQPDHRSQAVDSIERGIDDVDDHIDWTNEAMDDGVPGINANAEY